MYFRPLPFCATIGPDANAKPNERSFYHADQHHSPGLGGTEFLAQPHRLHLGAQKAEGVDRLEFSLPEQWNGCVVTLHIRHTDGTLAEPLALDETGCVSVGRSFTGWASGEWMLAAANGSGYTAYTRPGQYDVHGILPTEARAKS